MMFSELSAMTIYVGVGLALAGFVAFVVSMQSDRTLSFAFHKAEANVPFLAIMLRILAGPVIIVADACRRLARRQEGFGWLVTSTGAGRVLVFSQRLMVVSSVSLVG